MYSKTRNTLIALIVASLFLTTGWMFGQPIEATDDASQNVGAVQVMVAGSGTQVSLGSGAQVSLGPAALHARHSNRMSLAMPFYSFSLSMSQRRAD